jgi:hypothetical protein
MRGLQEIKFAVYLKPSKPHSNAPGGLFGHRSPCPRPPPLPRGHQIDPLAWHLTLASLGLCRPPLSTEEAGGPAAAATTAMKGGGVESSTATAADKGEVEEGEVEGVVMAVARDEEELGATEAWPQSDPLVDVHMEARENGHIWSDIHPVEPAFVRNCSPV